ncbi:B12-binding domain-containing radical SAM protein [Actinosynnema sp. NPDC059797]
MSASLPPPVCLVFPPLVESNFGSLYPAPAVLAAYLAEAGIACAQVDLNERFAEFLLTRDVLESVGRGELAAVGPDSMAAAVARWAARNREKLIDGEGRHHFGADSPYGYVMEILAQPFSVDPGPEALAGGQVDDPLREVYRRAFDFAGFGERVHPGTRLFGVTVAMGPQLVPSLALAGYLKAFAPAARVVLGGAAISLMGDDDLALLLAANPDVDCAVRFDGEAPLLALAEQVLQDRWEPAEVPGASVVRDGACHHQPPAPGPNLNALPFPAYPKEALDRLVSPSLSVTQARGCYWGKCDYCDFVELYGGSAPYRGRHPDRFAEEVERMVSEYGVRRFNFVTESIPPAFARRLSERLVASDLGITWNSFAMVDRRFDRELLSLMARSGCEFLVIGLETMVTRVLKLVHKSADREENFRFLRDARDTGMKLRINLIPDLPTTTYEESLSALADVERLTDCFESVSVFPFEATRSSNVGRDPGAFGLLTVDFDGARGQSQYSLNHLHNQDPAMTAEQRADVHGRYRAFANRVNARALVGDEGPALGLDAVVRLPVEDLDLFETGGTLVCTHIGTRERVSLPGRVAEALTPHRSGEPFAAGEIASRLGAANAEKVLAKLAAARVLVAAAPGGGRAR